MEIIKTSINTEDKKAIYTMTMAPNRGSVQSLKGQTVTVTDYIYYRDLSSKGEEIDMLSITTADGIVYTTISQFCIREAMKIFDLFGVPTEITVDSVICKNGREALYCTLA